MPDNEITADKARIEQEILKELEKELQNNPLNSHGRDKKKKAVSPPFEFDHHNQAQAIKEYIQGGIRYIIKIGKFAVYNSAKGIYETGEFALSSVWHVIERLARGRLESFDFLDTDEQDAAMSFGKKMLTGREGNHIKILLTDVTQRFQNLQFRGLNSVKNAFLRAFL